MDTLAKQVRQAQRRLFLQEFLAALAWSWFGTLLLAAVLIGVDKYYPLGVAAWGWFAGALGLGLVLAGVWAFARRRGQLDAAIEIDRRFGLKERVSSTLALGPNELETEVGQALVADTAKRVEQIHVAERFGISLGRWSWLPLAPAAAALLIALFMPQRGPSEVQAAQDEIATKRQVKRSTEALRQKLVDRRKEARERGLQNAENLFEKLEQGTRELSKSEPRDRKQALVKLNDLSQDLEKRRQELGGSDKLQQQLNQLKEMSKGPADKLADAMKAGDLKQAMQEIDKLKQELSNGKLNEQQRQELGKQMAEMQDKLKKLTDAHRQAQEDLKKQIEQKRASGQKQEAEELQQQLDQLAQQNPQMQQLQEMAEKLGQCSKCMQEGNAEEAMAALDSMKGDLESMQQQLDELAMLDEALDEIDAAKEAMNCDLCQGQGCAACRGDRPGNGLGEGRGIGERPEEKTDTKFYDSKVKQQQNRGSAVVTGMVEGPNIRGNVEQEIQTEFESVRTQASDPLTGQRLPREYRDHAKRYFDALREGQ